MRLVSLCSGYGGLELAVASVLDAETVAYAEIDKKAASVFARHWPDVPNLGDLTAVDWGELTDVDVLTAGYPCQPFSHAGKRGGDTDERHLWPAIRDAVRLLRPRYVVCENVRGHLTLGFDRVLGDLAGLGYCVRWTVVRAADVGAPHGRARLFFIAADASRERHGQGLYPRRVGRLDGTDAGASRERERSRQKSGDRGAAAVAIPDGEGLQGSTGGGIHAWRSAPRSGGEVDGLWQDYAPAINRWGVIIGRPAPPPTDERGRLSPLLVEWMMGLPYGWVTDTPGLSGDHMIKILGNGVVPQQAAAAITALLQAWQR